MIKSFPPGRVFNLRLYLLRLYLFSILFSLCLLLLLSCSQTKLSGPPAGEEVQPQEVQPRSESGTASSGKEGEDLGEVEKRLNNLEKALGGATSSRTGSELAQGSSLESPSPQPSPQEGEGDKSPSPQGGRQKTVDGEQGAGDREQGGGKSPEGEEAPEDVLHRLEQEKLIKNQEKQTLAEGYYQIAQDFYKRRDLDLAKKNLYRALQAKPDYLEASDLLQKIQLELGEIPPGDVGSLAQSEFGRMKAQIQAAQAGVENLFHQAVEAMDRKEYAEAEKKFNQVLESIRWFPYDLSTDQLKAKAGELLKQAQKLEKEQAFADRQNLEEAARRLASYEEERRLQSQRATVDGLFQQAIAEYQQGHYDPARHLLKQVLDLDPTYAKAKEFIPFINKKKLQQEEKDLWEKNIQESKKQGTLMEQKGIPYTRDLLFPAKKIWKEIAQRKPTGEDQLQATKFTPGEQHVETLLETTVFPAGYSLGEIKSVADLLDALRRLIPDAGFNYIGDNGEAPEATAFSVLLPDNTNVDLPVKTVLDELLPKNNFGYQIQGKNLFVYRANNANFSRRYPVVFYDVSDLLKPIRDFIPPQNSTTSSSPGQAPPGAQASSSFIGGAPVEKIATPPPKPIVDLNQLVTMICSFIPWKDSQGRVWGEKGTPPDMASPKVDSNNNSICGDDPSNPNHSLIYGMISTETIIVEQPADIQKKIKAFLNQIRQKFQVMVSIEARFLETNNKFLTDIGVDLRGLEADSLPPPDDTIPPPASMSAFPNNAFPFFTADIPLGTTTTASSTATPLPPGAQNQPKFSKFPSSGFAKGDIRARIENTLNNDSVISNFFQQSLDPKGGMTLQYTVLGHTMLEAILHAVGRDNRVKQIIDQQITAHDGERVSFQSVRRLIYVKGLSGVGQVLTPVPDQTGDGIVLDATPIVSSDRKYVYLELRPIFSTLNPPPPNIKTVNVFPIPPTTFAGAQPPPGQSTTTQAPPKPFQIETPVVEQRVIKTSAVVPDGGSILIGGLAVTSEVHGKAEVPILSNIPLLGSLFTQKVSGSDQDLILIIVTAKVIIPQDIEKEKF